MVTPPQPGTMPCSGGKALVARGCNGASSTSRGRRRRHRAEVVTQIPNAWQKEMPCG